ncbi:alpha/beta hydrolase [Streptomyces sp. B6B3]|uniref:alpha/beta hydrolase n=1 Tax=Streptomyces sp. B6B3 TaxID=3153570 RepID=UPI00325C393A
MGDYRSADPDKLEELADKLWTSGDGGAYGSLANFMDRARALDASGELSRLQPLLEWLRDAAQQMREGARILRGGEEEYREPIPGYVDSDDDDSGVQAEWNFEVSNQFHADQFLDIANQEELSEQDISQLQGLASVADEQSDFASYLVDEIGMEAFLDLWQRVDHASADMSETAQDDAEALRTSMGNILNAAMWVPGDLEPGTDAYQNWVDTTVQGQRYEERLDAFNLAGAQQLGTGQDSSLGYDVALDLLERSELPIDAEFFMQTMTHLSAPYQGSADTCVVWPRDVPERLATIAAGSSPQETLEWWNDLTAENQDALVAMAPGAIGNIDGVPSAVRDEANRLYLPMLIEELEGRDDADSQRKLEGLLAVQEQMAEETDPPMFLLGIGDEGNGRAIVSFGNPDTADNVSAYVPGLNTRLDAGFSDTMDRALQTAETARDLDSLADTASIVWLGYDAPIVGDSAGMSPLGTGGWGLPENLDVMSDEHAREGAPAYQKFLEGINVTSLQDDPHVTAIGHSYGSLTLAMATQEAGGVNADDIIILGSPGLGVDSAEDLGVGAEHVYVGAADNDVVTRLPSPEEAALGGAGALLGLTQPLGPIFGADVGGQIADWNDNEIWFGRDPASESFGAQRFLVDDGPPIVGGWFEAHSNYFNPQIDGESALNIARVVTGNGEAITPEEPR